MPATSVPEALIAFTCTLVTRLQLTGLTVMLHNQPFLFPGRFLQSSACLKPATSKTKAAEKWCSQMKQKIITQSDASLVLPYA